MPNNADTKTQSLTALRIFHPQNTYYAVCSFHFRDKRLTDKIMRLDTSVLCVFFVVVILILMYAFIVLVLFFFFFDCQADFDVDNVQRRELVNFYGV